MQNESQSAARIFVVLAPAMTPVPATFEHCFVDDAEYSARLARLQRLRGRIYLEDGAIEQWQLTEDGRHCLDSDRRSWHLLSVEREQVKGCARVQVYAPTVSFSDLTVARSAQARCAVWGPVLEKAVTAQLHAATAQQLNFAEPGGWALAPELRCTTEALHIALGSYALGELLGGCLGLSTATVRHGSASILRRLGGKPFVWETHALPRYYDPAYRCEMEIVRFDSREPSPKYKPLVERLKAELMGARVVCCVGEDSETMAQHLLALADVVAAQRDGLVTSTLHQPNAVEAK